MLQKLIKFVKDNLVAVVGIAAIVISCLLMLLPGQFANFHTSSLDRGQLNGYEFFFNVKVINGETTYPGALVGFKNEAYALPAAIAIFVLMLLSIVGYVLNRKSSAILLLVTLMMIALSIFFFAMEANAQKIYGIMNSYTDVHGKETFVGTIQWVSYFNGALIFLAACFSGYKTVLAIKNEVKHPTVAKNNTYNYLKK